MTTTMATEIESDHGIIYWASTFAYIKAYDVKVGDVILVKKGGILDFDRVTAWEVNSGGWTKVWFEVGSVVVDSDVEFMAAR